MADHKDTRKKLKKAGMSFKAKMKHLKGEGKSNSVAFKAALKMQRGEDK